jgi:hypothetical protein
MLLLAKSVYIKKTRDNKHVSILREWWVVLAMKGRRKRTRGIERRKYIAQESVCMRSSRVRVNWKVGAKELF